MKDLPLILFLLVVVSVLKSYRFYGVFPPTNVSSIELSYDRADTIEEFTVTLQVQWWDVTITKVTAQMNPGDTQAPGGGTEEL